MKIIQSLVFVFCFIFISFDSSAQALNDPTTWTYEVKKKTVGEYELIFHVVLKDGWHVFSLKPGDDFLIPPSFTFKKSNTVKLVGGIVEKGKLKIEKIDGIDNPINYYEGTADFVQVVKAKPNTKITGEHEYQVCNKNMCMPPKKKSFEFIIKD